MNVGQGVVVSVSELFQFYVSLTYTGKATLGRLAKLVSIDQRYRYAAMARDVHMFSARGI